MSAHRVDIEIEYTAVTGTCPECGANCPRHDDRKPRSWRHLDTMQFATCLHCSVPRTCLLRQVRCKAHGARTVKVPWAAKNSRFTLLFEGFAVRVLQAARGIEEARKRSGLNWHQVNAIKARAVQQRLSRRQAVTMPYPGIDEQPFRKGHKTISSLVDWQQGPCDSAQGRLLVESVQECGRGKVAANGHHLGKLGDHTSAHSVTMCIIGFILANTSMRPLIKCVARRTKHSRNPEIGVW